MKKYTIIAEDDALIVVNKPSGMLVIPAPGKERNTLTQVLNEELDHRGLEVNAYPCHRLDAETSGVILYAKGKAVQQTMMELFKQRKVRKEYLAFVRGRVQKKQGTITFPIMNSQKQREDPAITRYKVVSMSEHFSVVEVMPETGRKNQIRIHFKQIGHPLLGERVYAFKKDFPLTFKRVALHALSLSFPHPCTNAPVMFSAPLAEDMRAFLEMYHLN
jgi:23S rRNA pseudouridine1911/1915/1917 synthase